MAARAGKHRQVITGLMLVVILAATVVGPVHAAPLDYSVARGHFFAQANGQSGAGGLGFVVSDDEGIPFWSEFRRRGGAEVLGYPVSHRFEWRGTTVQVLQKAVLQWLPEQREVAFANVFDELSLAGKDEWLREARATPPPAWLPDESGLNWPEVVRQRESFLDSFPAIKRRYLGVPDPHRLYGLPASPVEDVGPAYVVRLQRAVMQLWKTDTPWARTGQVTVANGGDIAKEAGLFPVEAITPQSVDGGSSANIPRAQGRVVIALDPGHGGAEIGAMHRFADGSILTEKDVNLQIALKAAELLRGAGYEVVMTRAADRPVNVARRDLNNSRTVDVSDELQARVDAANAARAAAFVSIHNNGSANRAMRGTEVYYASDRPFAGQSLALAQHIQRNLLQALRAAGYESLDRRVKTDQSILRGGHFFLLGPRSRLVARPSEMPAALGEALFVSNASDAAQLRRPAIVEALARGYAAGIAQYVSASR